MFEVRLKKRTQCLKKTLFWRGLSINFLPLGFPIMIFLIRPFAHHTWPIRFRLLRNYVHLVYCKDFVSRCSLIIFLNLFESTFFSIFSAWAFFFVLPIRASQCFAYTYQGRGRNYVVTLLFFSTTMLIAFNVFAISAQIMTMLVLKRYTKFLQRQCFGPAEHLFTIFFSLGQYLSSTFGYNWSISSRLSKPTSAIVQRTYQCHSWNIELYRCGVTFAIPHVFEGLLMQLQSILRTFRV